MLYWDANTPGTINLNKACHPDRRTAFWAEVEGSPRTEQKPTKENPFTNEFFGERTLLDGVAANEAHLLNAKRNPSTPVVASLLPSLRMTGAFISEGRRFKLQINT